MQQGIHAVSRPNSFDNGRKGMEDVVESSAQSIVLIVQFDFVIVKRRLRFTNTLENRENAHGF